MHKCYYHIFEHWVHNQSFISTKSTTPTRAKQHNKYYILLLLFKLYY